MEIKELYSMLKKLKAAGAIDITFNDENFQSRLNHSETIKKKMNMLAYVLYKAKIKPTEVLKLDTGRTEIYELYGKQLRLVKEWNNTHKRFDTLECVYDDMQSIETIENLIKQLKGE